MADYMADGHSVLEQEEKPGLLKRLFSGKKASSDASDGASLSAYPSQAEIELEEALYHRRKHFEKTGKLTALRRGVGQKTCIGCSDELVQNGGVVFYCPECRSLKRQNKKLSRKRKREARDGSSTEK